MESSILPSPFAEHSGTSRRRAGNPAAADPTPERASAMIGVENAGPPRRRRNSRQFRQRLSKGMRLPGLKEECGQKGAHESEEADRFPGRPQTIAGGVFEPYGAKPPITRGRLGGPIHFLCRPVYCMAMAAFLWAWRIARGLRGCAFTAVSSTGVVPCTSAAKFAPAGTR